MKTWRGKTGLTLIETVISIMIMAMVAVAIASVMISTTVAYKKADLRQTSLYMIKTVSDKLKDFVTADVASLPVGLASGDYLGLCDDPDPFGTTATHDMSCYLDMPDAGGLTLRDKFPAGAEFHYEVEAVTCCNGCDAALTCKKVVFTVNYATG